MSAVGRPTRRCSRLEKRSTSVFARRVESFLRDGGTAVCRGPPHDEALAVISVLVDAHGVSATAATVRRLDKEVIGAASGASALFRKRLKEAGACWTVALTPTN